MVGCLPRILVIATIITAGCIISTFVSTSHTLPRHSLRPKSAKFDTDVWHGHRLLKSRLNYYNDPKTVELRPPASQGHAQIDGAVVVEGDGNPVATSLPGIGADKMMLLPPDPAVDPINLDALPPPPQQPINNDAAINNGNGIDNNIINNAYIETATKTASYNIDSALLTAQAFRYTLFFFVYDSATDTFVIVHNIPGCKYGCVRIYRIGSVVAYALRKNFPDRFQGADGGSEDWVVMISCGDAPRVKPECLQQPAGLHCESANFAPILQFGSVFVDAKLFPSMIAMPQSVRPFIPCFDEWQITGGQIGVCQDLQPRMDFTSTSIKSGMVFGEELGLMGDGVNYWDKLIPQIIWRGTDFNFLRTMFPGMRAPVYQLDIEPKQKSFPKDGSPYDDKEWAINTLWEMGDKLLPRWRGVLLTSEAELEARKYTEIIGDPKLPWVNIKFASINVKGIKTSLSENEEYQLLDKLGIAAIGEYVNMTTQARYKYHIDLGGGGGTTWTGTVEKLALPGLLFHHMTPTKDWFHDLLVPWEHYVPVETDLGDLHKKYEWAESHPVEAQQIAEQATEFARRMGSVEGFARLYEGHLVAPLRYTLRAYKPLPPRDAGKSVLEVIDERGGQEGFTIIGKCGGRQRNSCESLV